MLCFTMFRTNIIPLSKSSNTYHYTIQPQHSFPVKISKYKRNKFKHHSTRSKRKPFRKQLKQSLLLNCFHSVLSILITSKNDLTYPHHLGQFTPPSLQYQSSYDEKDLTTFLSSRNVLNSVKVLKVLSSREFLSSNHLISPRHLNIIGLNIAMLNKLPSPTTNEFQSFNFDDFTSHIYGPDDLTTAQHNSCQAYQHSIFNALSPDLPIVIDTGASTSITPQLSDFIGDLKPAATSEVNQLSGSTKIVGRGTGEW